jgi:hypothetical protein
MAKGEKSYMIVNLHDSEFAQLTKYKTQLQQTREQVLAIQAEADNRIARLVAQGDELVAVLNTSWLAANRRVMIEDPENFGDVEFPPMVNEMGQQMVNLKPKDKTAHWESVHDVKRIASEESQEEASEEEREDDNSN